MGKELISVYLKKSVMNHVKQYIHNDEHTASLKVHCKIINLSFLLKTIFINDYISTTSVTI